MEVDPDQAKHSFEYKGTTYLFCCGGCRAGFERAPDQFLTATGETVDKGAPASAEPLAMSVGSYTCPMHPDVVQEGPGSCPACGMALEPSMVSLEEPPNPELVDMTRRFWAGAALGLPVFALAMTEMVLGGSTDPACAAWALQLDSAHLCHAGSLLGRSTLLRTLLGVDRSA